MTVQSSLSLSDWNWAVLMLHQALVGAISPNIRMIELAFEESRWIVRVTLRTDDLQDREEIDDACDTMGAYLEDIHSKLSQDAYSKIVSDVVVSADPLDPSGGLEPRVVFMAREN